MDKDSYKMWKGYIYFYGLTGGANANEIFINIKISS